MRRNKLKSRNNFDDSEELSFEEDSEMNGICDTVPGTPVAQFCFTSDLVPSDEPMLKEIHKEAAKPLTPELNLTDNRTLRKQSYGKTPEVDGEAFDVSRTFMFRKSTVRILNRIKAEASDENLYLSSIVDQAIRFYGDYIFNKNNSEQ